MLKIEDVEKLRLNFEYGGITMVEWFNVNSGIGHCCIKSGLCNADGKTKSPYYYDYFLGGDKAEEKVLEHFNIWYNNLNLEMKK